jgi:hypothetical protein
MSPSSPQAIELAVCAAGGCEEGTARAKVTELTVQGRHLLLEDQPLGVTHLCQPLISTCFILINISY